MKIIIWFDAATIVTAIRRFVADLVPLNSTREIFPSLMLAIFFV